MTINLDGVLERGKTLDDFAREPESLVANVIKDAPLNEAIQQIRGQLDRKSVV